jgi:hypothetical protein
VADPIRAVQITQELKDQFLALIYEGRRPEDAARELGSTATQFKRLRNPHGLNYDETFAAHYKVAISSSEHREGFLEELRTVIWEEARRGNARLLEKLAFIYDPDWEPLRSTNFNMNVQLVARVLPYLSDDELQKAISAAEADRQLPDVEMRALARETVPKAAA